jgi:hypothetical protein
MPAAVIGADPSLRRRGSKPHLDDQVSYLCLGQIYFRQGARNGPSDAIDE